MWLMVLENAPEVIFLGGGGGGGGMPQTPLEGILGRAHDIGCPNPKLLSITLLPSLDHISK